MKTIKASNGVELIVDDEDYPVLNRFTWFDSIGTYATDLLLVTGKARIPISKFIYGQSKVSTKHTGRLKAIYLNGNYADCRKSNLKMVSFEYASGKNGKEQGKNRGYTSIYRGVSRQKHLKTKMWWARLNIGGGCSKHKRFDTEREAGLWWNKIAKEHWGEGAYQNQID